MVTETEVRPLSIQDASRAVDEALEAMGRQAKAYRRLRAGLDRRATAKAHADYGFATLEFVGACVMLAGVADRVDPVWAAAREKKSQPVPTAAGPECDAAWHAYQEARRSGNPQAIDAARGRWRDALLDWHLQVHKHHGAEDQNHAASLSRCLDESTRLDPWRPFGPQRSGRDAVVSESRERERQDSIRRANAGLSNPWVRSSRSRRRQSGR